MAKQITISAASGYVMYIYGGADGVYLDRNHLRTVVMRLVQGSGRD